MKRTLTVAMNLNYVEEAKEDDVGVRLTMWVGNVLCAIESDHHAYYLACSF